jgi:hypothetical protein
MQFFNILYNCSGGGRTKTVTSARRKTAAPKLSTRAKATKAAPAVGARPLTTRKKATRKGI